jgi:hypothetical protein
MWENATRNRSRSGKILHLALSSQAGRNASSSRKNCQRNGLAITFEQHATVAELADAPDLGSCNEGLPNPCIPPKEISLTYR